MKVYFLQCDVLPSEYSASFALERFKCFSRTVPAFPVTSPFPSITITWNSSNLPFLSATYSDVPGLSEMVFQEIVDPTLVRVKVC